MHSDLDSANRPCSYSIEIPVTSFIHIEELTEEDEFSTLAVDNTGYVSTVKLLRKYERRKHKMRS